MKNLTELKKRLVIGAKLIAYNHIDKKDLGERVLSIKQTNAVAFRLENGKDSWLQMPKASEVTLRENSFTITELENGVKIPILTYTFAVGH